MKESRQWKDGVELFLDNRQIFLLFFASAVVLSLVFALGVVVGKRSGDLPPTQPATDPLALLDQMGGQDKLDDNLTFHEALSKEDKDKDRQAAGADAMARTGAEGRQAPGADQPAPPAVDPKASPAKQPQQAPSEERDVVKEALEKKALAARADPAEEPHSKAKDRDKDRDKDKDKIKDKIKIKLTEASPRGKARGGSSKSDDGASSDPPAGVDVYSLQLSSFQDKGEAEVFMGKLREGGMKPFLIPAQIPGRGVWYRVRLGTYGSWDEALAAKQSFEQNQKIIAYVAKN